MVIQQHQRPPVRRCRRIRGGGVQSIEIQPVTGFGADISASWPGRHRRRGGLQAARIGAFTLGGPGAVFDISAGL